MGSLLRILREENPVPKSSKDSPIPLTLNPSSSSIVPFISSIKTDSVISKISLFAGKSFRSIICKNFSKQA